MLYSFPITKSKMEHLEFNTSRTLSSAWIVKSKPTLLDLTIQQEL